jgi:hypothetical protein
VKVPLIEGLDSAQRVAPTSFANPGFRTVFIKNKTDVFIVDNSLVEYKALTTVRCQPLLFPNFSPTWSRVTIFRIFRILLLRKRDAMDGLRSRNSSPFEGGNNLTVPFNLIRSTFAKGA